MGNNGIVVKQESQAIGKTTIAFGHSKYGAGSGAVANVALTPVVAVPEGGSTLLFILAALTAMGWAATKRYWSRREGRGTLARITG